MNKPRDFIHGGIYYRIGDLRSGWGRSAVYAIYRKPLAAPDTDEDGESNWDADCMSLVAIEKLTALAVLKDGTMQPWQSELLNQIPGWKEFCEMPDDNNG